MNLHNGKREIQYIAGPQGELYILLFYTEDFNIILQKKKKMMKKIKLKKKKNRSFLVKNNYRSFIFV